MAVPTYRSVKNSTLASYFGMNEVSFLRFSETNRFHLTDGLNACFGVFLVSPVATVSAHIPPHPGSNFDDPQAGDKNLITKMQEFATLYRSNQVYFSNYNVCLVFAKFHGKSPLPDKKAFIEKCLLKLKVDFPMQDYEVKAPGEPRSDEHGTAFVDGGAPTGATLYVEDRMVMRVYKHLKTLPPNEELSVRHGQTSTSEAQSPRTLFPREEASARHHQKSVAEATPSWTLFPREQTSGGHQTACESQGGVPATGKDAKADTMFRTKRSKELRYVKSERSRHAEGARIVELSGQQITINAEEWEKAEYEGRKILICEKYKLYTDF